MLQINGGGDLSLSSDGAFTFASQVPNAAAYSVTVLTQPSGRNCVVRNASGVIASANVSDVTVSCASDQFTIGGTVSGLVGSGLTLLLNGEVELAISTNGGFAFPVGVADGARYEIALAAQPRDPSQVCSIANSVGTVSGANVTNATVSCASSSFSVGGTVSGLTGTGLVVQLNDGDDLAVTSNGSFTFATTLASGDPYRVTVATQPENPTQRCTVGSGRGTVGSTNVSNVRITCAANTQSVGGTVNDLLGFGLVLQNNGGDDVTIDFSGPFVFPGELASGAAYNVTVRTQPSNPSQACTITNARGTIGMTDVTNVVVNCSTSDFTIGGTVLDMEGSGLVLRNNGTDELTIESSGSFTFDTALPAGASYDVTIAEQPRDPGQQCSVVNGAGTVGLRNVTNVTVRCSTIGFAVGGRVSRLRGSGLVLQNNGSDDLPIGSSGSFRFPTRLPSGSPYDVTVARQPDGPPQTCTVTSGSGTIDNSDIADVRVRCERDDDDD